MSHAQAVQAISVGHALDVDSPAYGAVHSVFVRAVNLTIRGDMWTLLAEDKADLPFGIRVALSNFNRLGLRRSDLVSVRSGFVGIGSQLVVDCRAAPRWLPACEKTRGRVWSDGSQSWRRLHVIDPGTNRLKWRMR